MDVILFLLWMKNKSTGNCFVRQKLGENYVGLTTCENRCSMRVKLKGADTKIKYLRTLRENYCQRIANESFAYPLRVGINFAKK